MLLSDKLFGIAEYKPLLLMNLKIERKFGMKKKNYAFLIHIGNDSYLLDKVTNRRTSYISFILFHPLIFYFIWMRCFTYYHKKSSFIDMQRNIENK